MKIYAMSDIHGCLQAFEYSLSLVDLTGDNILILLGDYIHGLDDFGVLNRILDLQSMYGSKKVVALMGNHEEMAISNSWPINGIKTNENDLEFKYYLDWMALLPRYYTTQHQIFVHAGIDEEAGDMWELVTDDNTFIAKYPVQTGEFYMDIVAGHIGTSIISDNPGYHDIYYDGESHYFIDGNVIESGSIPVLMVDTDQNKYYRVTEDGLWLILSYDEEN